MRCQDLTCQHTEAAHTVPVADSSWAWACRHCTCKRFREATPRAQQIQLEYAKMLPAQVLRGQRLDWLSIPDPTAERKPGRSIDRIHL